jgi:diguanylate cyclase (GGDEF)-like protein
VIGFSTANTFTQLQQRQFTLLKRESLIILLIAIAQFIALSLIIIRPVTNMSEILENSVDANGRVIANVPVVSNDEFGQLAERFNRLGQQLNVANDRLQSKIDIADQELVAKNRQLIKQAEELKLINREFQKMAITDALTGLYNRRHFENMLESEMELANRYGDVNSLLVIDLDHFKKINDNHGHPAGDFVLREIAIILSECFRKNDILCRVGGEEFVAICRRAGKSNAMKIAEKLRRTIEHSKFIYGDITMKITASIGVATTCPQDAQNGSLCLYRRADSAVYGSKQNGRNRVTHHDDIEAMQNKMQA